MVYSQAKFLFLIIFFFPSLLHAKINSVQEEGLRLERFNFKEVCEYYGVKDPLIPSKSSEKTIDCMGRDFDIQKICIEKYKLVPNYTRARFDVTNKFVNCHFSSTSVVEILCAGEHQSFCKDPDLSCQTIKPNFAYNHIFSNSIIVKGENEVLKCLYSSSEKIKI